MKKLYYSIFALAAILMMGSCQKDFTNKYANGGLPDIPFDFDWKTTRDISFSAAAPSVDGHVPDFALVDVYSSPVLSEDNRIARGLIDASNSTFSTAFTLPLSVENLYVRTTVPDGRCMTEMIPVSGVKIGVPGLAFSAGTTEEMRALQEKIRMTAFAVKESSMVIPVSENIPSSYDRTISSTPAQMLYIGGDSRVNSYLIPAGATVEGNINMSGWTNNLPVLYVAGKLSIRDQLEISKTRLVVLPGGEVETDDALALNNAFDDKASVYVFEGGFLKVGNLRFDQGRTGTLVNKGTLYITGSGDSAGKLKMNGGKFYTATGINSTEEGAKYKGVEVRASYAEMHIDGTFEADEIEIDASSTLVNYENGRLSADDFDLDQSVLVQKGDFSVEEMDLSSGATINNQCRMRVDKLEANANNNRFDLAAGSLLTVRKECEMTHAQISMARHSMFVIEEMGDEDKDFYNNTFTGPSADSDTRTPVAVLKFGKNGHGGSNKVSGLVEIVLDSKNNHKLFSKIKDGATLVREQTVDIPSTECNGGSGGIQPAPIDPVDEFDVNGALYTYCFEDSWPWFGDYDMNDLVVAVSIDRQMKAGRVAAIRINWEPKASGADNFLAFAVCLDKVPTSNIASVVSSHKIGAGPFEVADGLELDNEYAVIPLFNSVGEVLGTDNNCVNTIIGQSIVSTRVHTTTVVFVSPVAVEDVLESMVNMFLVATRSDAKESERWREIHLPGFQPTKHAVVSGFNTVISDMPYKYYAMGGDVTNNGLMWGLMIPGEFHYPSETNDIRTVYDGFLPWAKSGGTTDRTWYEGNAAQEKVYR